MMDASSPRRWYLVFVNQPVTQLSLICLSALGAQETESIMNGAVSERVGVVSERSGDVFH